MEEARDERGAAGVGAIEMAAKGTVCVTGAGGYVASWLVKLLLSNGYKVHGTVRDPDDQKNAHLRRLEKASENLQLFKADLLDYDSLMPAIVGCEGVFHTASPVPPGKVPNPEIDLIAPAVTGTLNVLKACSAAKVHRVVVVSSVASVYMNLNWPSDKNMNEDCWSDKDYCKSTENWYCLSKTLAEAAAFDYAKESGLEVVTLLPSMVFGPLLQPTLNASSMVLVNLVKGLRESVENVPRQIVDVRDVVDALLLLYKKPEATGRYICSAYHIKTRDLVAKLKDMYPNYKYPKIITEVAEEKATVSSEKLKAMGWKPRALEETLADSIECFRQAGLLE